MVKLRQERPCESSTGTTLERKIFCQLSWSHSSLKLTRFSRTSSLCNPS
ncbi:hypothetical protein ACHAXN_006988 [Cyclotella atomus]